MKTPCMVTLGCCLALFFITTPARSQTPVNLGLEGGVNFGNASTSPSSISLSSRTGVMAGALLEIGLSEALYLQPEVFYAQKGAEFSVSSPNGSGTITWKVDYIEIPILLEGKFGQSEFKPLIFAGPNIGFNLSANAEATNGTNTGSVDIKDQIESMDFALDFGAGGEYMINSTTSFITTIRYSLGMTDINKDATDSWKTTGVQLLAGFKFRM